MFSVYVWTGSDFKVRDWLKAHGITLRNGRDAWQISTLRKPPSNRLLQHALPEEVQRRLRLLVRRVEWHPQAITRCSFTSCNWRKAAAKPTTRRLKERTGRGFIL